MRAALPALLVVLLVAGCVTVQNAPGTDPPAPGSSGANRAAPASSASTLDVRAVVPYRFDPGALSARAGSVLTVRLANEDPAQGHAFALEAAAVDGDPVSAGGTGTFSFTAPAAGAYEYFCPVENHRALGMRGTFTAT